MNGLQRDYSPTDNEWLDNDTSGPDPNALVQDAQEPLLTFGARLANLSTKLNNGTLKGASSPNASSGRLKPLQSSGNYAQVKSMGGSDEEMGENVPQVDQHESSVQMMNKYAPEPLESDYPDRKKAKLDRSNAQTKTTSNLKSSSKPKTSASKLLSAKTPINTSGLRQSKHAASEFKTSKVKIGRETGARKILRESTSTVGGHASSSGRPITKETIANLYQSQTQSLTDYKLPRLAEYFKELNTQNMCYTLTDRINREELWMIAKERMLEDRRRLQEKLQVSDCSFRPQINVRPGKDRERRIGHPNLVAGNRSVARQAHQASHTKADELSASKHTRKRSVSENKTYEEMFEQRSRHYNSSRSAVKV